MMLPDHYLQAVADAVHEYGGLFVLDCIASGAIWVDMRASHASYLGRPAAVGNFIDITREIKAEEQVRQLSRRLIEAIEEERRSLANDIHDEFGQLLTLLQFDIEALQNSLPPTSTESAW